MSRATDIGVELGIDVAVARARYAADRVRYRAAISAALDRLTGVERTSTQREPVPYAAAGMTDPFERREVNGRGESEDQARTTGRGSGEGMASSLEDPGPAGDGRRDVPVPVRLPQRQDRRVV